MAAMTSLATVVGAGASHWGAARQAEAQRQQSRAQAQATAQQEQARQQELVSQRVV